MPKNEIDRHKFDTYVDFFFGNGGIPGRPSTNNTAAQQLGKQIDVVTDRLYSPEEIKHALEKFKVTKSPEDMEAWEIHAIDQSYKPGLKDMIGEYMGQANRQLIGLLPEGLNRGGYPSRAPMDYEEAMGNIDKKINYNMGRFPADRTALDSVEDDIRLSGNLRGRQWASGR